MKRTIFFALSLLTIFSVEAGRDLRNGFQQKHQQTTHEQRHMPRGKQAFKTQSSQAQKEADIKRSLRGLTPAQKQVYFVLLAI